MGLDARYSHLLELIYTAGRDQKMWDEALADFFEMTGCSAGIIALTDVKQMQLLSCRAYAAPGQNLEIASEEYATRYYREDPMLLWVADHPKDRFCDSRHTPSAGTVTPFWKWDHTRFGSTFNYIGFTAPDEDITFSVTGHFQDEPPEHRSAELAQFQDVFNHIECAIRLGKKPFNHNSSRCLIRVAGDGAVQQLSRGAFAVLHQRPALRIHNGHLITDYPGQQIILDRALERMLRPGSAIPKPAAVQIQNENGRPWNVVMRTATDHMGPLGDVRRHVQLEIIDHIPAIGRLELVQSLFELTGRELQVITLLAGRHSVDSLSHTMGVSRNTTRAHLRSIFAKTHTGSQSELMLLCGGLCRATEEEVLELAD